MSGFAGFAGFAVHPPKLIDDSMRKYDEVHDGSESQCRTYFVEVNI